MRPILRSAKPEIDGFLYALRGERHLYFSTFSGRCVSGIQDLHYDQPIVSGCLGLLFTPHATCEVRHLLREAVVPQLFENWIAPPFCARRLLHRVAITILAICGERVAHVKIGVGHAVRPMYLDSVVHSATPPPAVLDNAYCTALKFQNANGLVVSSRLVGVNVGAHLAVHRLDRGTPKEPVAESNPVATEIHKRAAAAVIHIPEPWSMRSKMLFALLHEMDFADGAIIRHFSRHKIFGGKEQ